MYHEMTSMALRQVLAESIARWEHSRDSDREINLEKLHQMVAKVNSLAADVVYVQMNDLDLLGIGDKVRTYRKDTIVTDASKELVIA